MKANKQKKLATFKTMDEYFTYYKAPIESKPAKGSKYYRIGQDIARMACEKAAHGMQPSVTIANR